MPLPTERLSKKSSDDEVKRAIQRCISLARSEGKEADQAVAMCYSSARENAGSRSFMRRRSWK